MIRHVVMLNLPENHDSDALQEAMDLLQNLEGAVPGMQGFRHGRNLDFEKKSGIYDYGFSVDFASRAVHLAYETHPDHQRAGGMLVGMCAGGYEGIFVIDLEIAPEG